MTLAKPLSAFGAVILAAGLSTRMQGPNKLLCGYRGKPLLAHVCETVAHLRLGDAVVVTGRDSGETAKIAENAKMRSAYNPDYARGMGTSISAGIAALSADLAGMFIVLGDMPHVQGSDFQTLAAHFKPGLIVVPIHQGEQGHPVLFCSTYRRELLKLDAEKGARRLLEKSPEAIRKVNVAHAGILRDFDTAADFAKAHEANI